MWRPPAAAAVAATISEPCAFEYSMQLAIAMAAGWGSMKSLTGCMKRRIECLQGNQTLCGFRRAGEGASFCIWCICCG